MSQDPEAAAGEGLLRVGSASSPAIFAHEAVEGVYTLLKRLEDLCRRRIRSAECGSKYFQAGGSIVLIKFCDAFRVAAQ